MLLTKFQKFFDKLGLTMYIFHLNGTKLLLTAMRLLDHLVILISKWFKTEDWRLCILYYSSLEVFFLRMYVPIAKHMQRLKTNCIPVAWTGFSDYSLITKLLTILKQRTLWGKYSEVIGLFGKVTLSSACLCTHFHPLLPLSVVSAK
jgi:hypothetical protein